MTLTFDPSRQARRRRSVARRFGDRCLMCGAEGVPFTLDHVQPKSAGGNRNRDNLQPLCEPCNNAKWCLWIDLRIDPPLWNDHGEVSVWTPRHTEILLTHAFSDRMWRLRALSAGWEI